MKHLKSSKNMNLLQLDRTKKSCNVNPHNLLLLFFLGMFSQVKAQYFPPITGNQWDTLSPQRFGYCSDRIDSLYQLLDAKKSKAFILIKDGKIVLEKYFDNFTQDSLWYWASAGKTLTSAVVGVLEEQGKLTLTEPSNKYLGAGWTSLQKNQEDSITIWHQLTMTTGLDDAPATADCTDPSCLTYKAAVGKRWSYHNAPYTLLDKVISSSSGKTLNQVILNEFTLTTGLKVAYIKMGLNNVAVSTPRNFARFGLLLLNGGKWGNSQIIPASYYSQMVSSSQSMNPSYGFLTWLNGKDKFMIPQSQLRFNGDCMIGGPSDLIMALGKDGQQIQVSPSENMVWIRMGEAPDSKTPLVNFTLGAEIWDQINQLKCNTTDVDAIENSIPSLRFPNPIRRGESLNLLEGNSNLNTNLNPKSSDFKNVYSISLVDALGRVYFLQSDVIPINMATGVYQLRVGNVTSRVLIVD
jgi:CubicO group peptidase (beta-lactamase class C family)